MEEISIFSISAARKTDWTLIAKRFPSLIKVTDQEITFISSVYFKVNKVLNYLVAPVIFLIGMLAMVSAIVQAV